jgi:hypothetical protein
VSHGRDRQTRAGPALPATRAASRARNRQARAKSAGARTLRICARHGASNASTSAHLCGRCAPDDAYTQDRPSRRSRRTATARDQRSLQRVLRAARGFGRCAQIVICVRHGASNASTSAHLCGMGTVVCRWSAHRRERRRRASAQRSTDRPAPIVTAAPTSNRAPLAAAAVARRSCRWVENRVGRRPLRDAARLRTKRRDPACTTCRGCGLGVRRPDTQAHDDMPPAACCAWRARSSHTETGTGRTGASLPHRPWPSKCP